jgi:hypothetical protein
MFNFNAPALWYLTENYFQFTGTKRLAQQREVFFEEEHMSYLIKGLKIEKLSLQKRVLKCILWALHQQGKRSGLNITCNRTPSTDYL